ncbi:SDR family oxidoreductase [Streptomyces bambusae]|uniref:oxidoreductase n=1 Tax=Streptomyces bambusae TaxID=1550616 RepID=UPI001CFD7C93|nr:oxidoreductase [Streptomyces bambusae]MCB5165688.1 SDR family oxidoreductase [Streptomyces bambusae]
MAAGGAWTAQDVPDQSGRTAVVTGAASGLGLETARALAVRGAHVVLAVRDSGKAAVAAARIRAAAPRAELTVQHLDLADLASVREAAKQLADLGRIDLLVNNAGVMWTPYTRTVDGHELQFATNHLGHFALTGLLLDTLRATPGARVVTISSYLHRFARIDFGGLDAEHGYNRYRAYSQSKLANLMFSRELHRRLEQAGDGTLSVAAHPGLAATGLGRELPALVRRLGPALGPLFLQRADQGMLPGLRAATDPAVRGGTYYGPTGITETRGRPGPARPGRAALDGRAAARLWEESERLTGVAYGL